jgi:hypothetical protein
MKKRTIVLLAMAAVFLGYQQVKSTDNNMEKPMTSNTENTQDSCLCRRLLLVHGIGF